MGLPPRLDHPTGEQQPKDKAKHQLFLLCEKLHRLQYNGFPAVPKKIRGCVGGSK
jgi:hypothetical protein